MTCLCRFLLLTLVRVLVRNDSISSIIVCLCGILCECRQNSVALLTDFAADLRSYPMLLVQTLSLGPVRNRSVLLSSSVRSTRQLLAPRVLGCIRTPFRNMFAVLPPSIPPKIRWSLLCRFVRATNMALLRRIRCLLFSTVFVIRVMVLLVVTLTIVLDCTRVLLIDSEKSPSSVFLFSWVNRRARSMCGRLVCRVVTRRSCVLAVRLVLTIRPLCVLIRLSLSRASLVFVLSCRIRRYMMLVVVLVWWHRTRIGPVVCLAIRTIMLLAVVVAPRVVKGCGMGARLVVLSRLQVLVI